MTEPSEAESPAQAKACPTKNKIVRKVLHVIPSVGVERGGPSVMVRTMAQGLSQAGIETHVATTDDNGKGRLRVEAGRPCLEDGVTYWYFPRQTRFYTFSWPLSRWLARHVRDYDVVHIHALFSYAALPAAYWSRRWAVPYVVRPLGTLNRWGMRNRRRWLKGLSFRLIERRILKHAALIHYTSEQERCEAMELRVEGRSEIIANALPEVAEGATGGGFRERHTELTGRRIVLFLSRFDRKKGLDLLLPAFAEVVKREPEAVLVLAGSGSAEMEEELKGEIGRLGLGRDVVWAGFLEGKEKRAALADAEVFVLPSYSENFGIAVVEAMAAGLPVVVSDQVGIHREIAEAGAGVVVECRVEAIRDGLLRLLEEGELRETMGRNGQKAAREQYSVDVVTGKLVQVYNEIAG